MVTTMVCAPVAGRTCGKADGKVQEIDKPLGHDWDDGELKDADCEKAERVVYTCERCGEVKEEIIPNGEAAKGHKFVDKIVAPTCKTKGYTERTCERCDLYEKINETEIDKDAHVAKLDKVIREATCTVNGLGRYTCELCGEYLGYRAIEAKHVYGAPIFDEGKEATCGKDGYGYYVCAVCGEETEKDVIPATGKHEFVDETVIPATCTEPEKVGRICKVSFSPQRVHSFLPSLPQVGSTIFQLWLHSSAIAGRQHTASTSARIHVRIRFMFLPLASSSLS